MTPLRWHCYDARTHRATLVLGGLLPVQLTVTATSWEAEGADGRRVAGECRTVPDGMRDALEAVAQAIERGRLEVGVALKEIGP